ncbi:MAG: hypothetical protein PHE65_06265 [Candidatus Omnitrophica bacterium]|nr:hypothetical protein [Candidatus Omnitrophota bacterium]
MAPDAAFEKGACYTRAQIRDMIGGGSVQDYMPASGGKILCVCLSQDFNGAEPVILVGAGPAVQKQAEAFCEQNMAVPLFFKKEGNQWEYAGSFGPERWSQDPQDLVDRAEASGRVNLTKVIYLREAEG